MSASKAHTQSERSGTRRPGWLSDPALWAWLAVALLALFPAHALLHAILA